jgi:hypothetical protein
MRYRRATANRRDFFGAPALSDTATAARTIKAPAVAGAQGKALRLGALHPVSGALPSCGQQCRSTGPRTVEGRTRIAVALLIASVVAAPAVFSPRDARSAEYTLMPSPQTVHIGHFSAALKPVLTINSGDTSRSRPRPHSTR